MHKRKEAIDYVVGKSHFPNLNALVVIVSLQIPRNRVSQCQCSLGTHGFYKPVSYEHSKSHTSTFNIMNLFKIN